MDQRDRWKECVDGERLEKTVSETAFLHDMTDEGRRIDFANLILPVNEFIMEEVERIAQRELEEEIAKEGVFAREKERAREYEKTHYALLEQLRKDSCVAIETLEAKLESGKMKLQALQKEREESQIHLSSARQEVDSAMLELPKLQEEARRALIAYECYRMKRR